MTSNTARLPNLDATSAAVVDSIEGSLRDCGGFHRPDLERIVKDALVTVLACCQPASQPAAVADSKRRASDPDQPDSGREQLPLELGEPGAGAGEAACTAPTTSAAKLPLPPLSGVEDPVEAMMGQQRVLLQAQLERDEAIIAATKPEEQVLSVKVQELEEELLTARASQEALAAHAAAVMSYRSQTEEKVQRREAAREAAGQAYITEMQRLGIDGAEEKLQTLREKPDDSSLLRGGQLLPAYARLHSEVLELQASLRISAQEAEEAKESAESAASRAQDVEAELARYRGQLEEVQAAHAEAAARVLRAREDMAAMEGKLREAVEWARTAALGTLTVSTANLPMLLLMHEAAAPKGRVFANSEVVEITGSDGTVSASSENGPHEGAARAFDGTVSTKWLDFGFESGSEAWLQIDLHSAPGVIVHHYVLTSANDGPYRDPKDWLLEGYTAKEGKWEVLDSQSDHSFTARHQASSNFEVRAHRPCTKIRLRVTKIGGGPYCQLARLQLFCMRAIQLVALE